MKYTEKQQIQNYFLPIIDGGEHTSASYKIQSRKECVQTEQRNCSDRTKVKGVFTFGAQNRVLNPKSDSPT